MHQLDHIKMIYTSDIHGKISVYDFVSKDRKGPGLSRFSSYLKSLNEPYILIDNGDVLQGSPLIDYAREHHLPNPVSKSLNILNYDFYTLGNHDFNYGSDYLNDFIHQNKATLLCCNIVDDANHPIYQPYDIKEVNGYRIGFIGAITQYIPVWEKPEHIQGLNFISAYDAVKKYVIEIKDRVDAIIVFYHGGYERDLNTGDAIGRPTVENEGYHIFQIPEINVLLCGHQHMPTIYQKGLKVTLQTGSQALNFGEVNLYFNAETKALTKLEAHLIDNNFDIDASFENEFQDLVTKTDLSLDQPIGQIDCDMSMNDPFLDRKNNHLFFEFVNHIQKEITGANISIASLPNNAIGISKLVTKRELAANFIYVNALVKMEITGKILRAALEKNAHYFSLEDDQVVINDAYLNPKVEHYNFDVYDGIHYTYKISNPEGQKVILLTYHDKPIKDEDTFTICLNSYRANGGGDFFMFTKGKILETFDISYVDIMIDFIRNNPNFNITSAHQFSVII